jgi:hypothetical protein
MISEDLFRAVLAMDVYNRGYNEDCKILGLSWVMQAFASTQRGVCP